MEHLAKTNDALSVSKGYKQTEVGVIPKDWEVIILGEKSISFSGGTPSTNNKDYYNGKIPWISSSELNQKRITKTTNYISELGLNSSAAKMVNEGTFLIAMYGATAGVPAITKIGGAINQAVLAVESNSILSEYLYEFFSLRKEGIINTYCQGGQPNLSGQIVKSIKIPLPPTLTEQRAIATVLSDTDALIQALEKKIAKKKSIKKGVMQELLRPKEGWERVKLGESAILKARIGWQGLTTAEYLDTGDYFLITGTDFKNGFIDWGNCVFVEKNRYDQDKNIQISNGDVLVTKDGTIGKVAMVNNVPKPTTLNSGVFVIRPKNKAFDSQFFYYVLMSNHFKEFLLKLTAGSTISHLYQKDFIHFNFRIPPTLSEQHAIATALSNIDEEISLLEQKLAKYQLAKQGLMQQLLTGKIRLV